MYTDPSSKAKWGISVDVLRADVSTKRLIPILTAVAIAAIDGVRTYLIEIVGFLTGICLGAFSCKRSNEPTQMKMTKQEALAALQQRRANRPERIDSDTPGAPTFFYCEICGALADARLPAFPTAVWGDRSSSRYSPPPIEPLCEACCEMKNAGWLKSIKRPIMRTPTIRGHYLDSGHSGGR
jgi:hypothetical protein